MIRFLPAALLVTASCYAAGRLAARNRHLPAAVLFTLGMALLSTVFFALVSSGLANRVLFIAVGTLPLLGLATVHPKLVKPPRVQLTLCTSLAAVYLVHIFVHALSPEVQFDAAGYHLGLPAEWLRLGRFPARVGFYEMLPQGMESIYAFTLALGSSSVTARLVHFACLAALISLLFPLARLLGLPAWTAPATSLIFVSSPLVGLTAASAYTDMALALAFLATFYLSVAAWREPAGPLWLLAGLTAGFCYGVKPPGLLAPAAISAFLLFRKQFGPLLRFTAGASVTLLPWMLRALWITGNPLAPLFDSVFRNPYFPPELDRSLTASFHSFGGVKAFQIPLDLAIHGARLQGVIGPLVLLLPLGVLGLLRKETRLPAIWGIGLLLMYTQNIGARFLLPAFLVLSMCVIALLPRRIAAGVALAAAILCFPPLAIRYADPPYVLAAWPWKVAAGLETEQDYLRRNLASYPFAAFVRTHVEPGSVVFDCFGLPSFYARAATMQYWQSMDMLRLFWSLQRASAEDRNRPDLPGQFRSAGVRYLSMQLSTASQAQWAADVLRDPARWGFLETGRVGDYVLYRTY